MQSVRELRGPTRGILGATLEARLGLLEERLCIKDPVCVVQ